MEWKDGKEAWRVRLGKEDQEREWRERERDRETETETETESVKREVDRVWTERDGESGGRMYIGGGVEREVCEKGW